MKLSLKNLSELYNVFNYFSIDYYKRNGRLEVLHKLKTEKSIYPPKWELNYIFLLSNNEMEYIGGIKQKSETLLRDAKYELLANLYSFSSENAKSNFLEEIKKEFYTLVILRFHYLYYQSYLKKLITIKVDNKLSLSSSEMFENYLLDLSSLAYKWAYIILNIELTLFPPHKKLKDIDFIEWGTMIREDLVYKILYYREFNSIDDEESSSSNLLEQVSETNIEEKISSYLKHCISFSEGALLKFISGSKFSSNDFIKWSYKGRKKNLLNENNEKTPNLLELSIFSLSIIDQNCLAKLKTDSKIAEYITNSVGIYKDKCSYTIDKSTISRARKIIESENILNIDDLIKHFEQ